MAESVEAFEFSLQETLKDLSNNGKQIDLKPEQGAAIKSLVHGQDVLAILPTGFGKSAIYQILVGVKEKMSKDCACVLVICPLRSLIEDQIKEANLWASKRIHFQKLLLQMCEWVNSKNGLPEVNDHWL